MKSKVQRLHSRANSLITQFERGGGTSCIDQAINLDCKALELCPSNHRKRFVSLTWLAFHLCYRYTKLGGITDLDAAIVLAREALHLRPLGHPERPVSLNNLAGYLSTRHNQLRAVEDLDEAIILNREALDLRPPGHPNRFMSLDTLAILLFARYRQLGALEDLDEAIILNREALDPRPPRHSERSMYLNNLAISLSTRYRELGALEDVDEAIILAQEALDLSPLGHSERSMSLNTLAISFFTRYEQLGALEDVEEAILLDREALQLCPPGHPERWASLTNLAYCLSARYQQLGVLEDLDAAIVLAREVLDLRPPGHPERSMSLSDLACHVSIRYEQLGEMEDLDKAIVLARKALALHPQGHPGRPLSLNNLAVHLFNRYKQLGAVEDLNEAITLDREALDLRPLGNSYRSTSLHNLATRLSARHEQLGTLEDLEAAIVLEREALDLRPPGHPYRPTSLDNLAVHLLARYNQSGVMEDLNEAIVLDREALGLRPLGHSDRFMSLNNLAVCLSTRYNRLDETEDLDVAIDLVRDGLAFCTPGRPHRLQSLGNLARNLHTRFTRARQVEDKEALFSLYAQLVDVPQMQMVSSADLSTARAWIRAAEDFNHPTTLLAYETSFRLLIQYLAILPSLPQHLAILKSLTSSLAVDAFSACIRNHAPERAVELLEQGRGVFWSQLTRLRSPLDDVTASSAAGKTLVDEFTQLASLIRGTLDSPGADRHERVCHLNVQLERLVTNIRELPGLSRFLLPSLFSDLQCAACAGPVIIVNASKYSCDALVVLLDRDPVHIPLQITHENVRDLSTEVRTLTARATRADVTGELAYLLRKLWDQIVSPIVDFLQTILPAQSRVWWCPTAEFSVLPLHAAGPYRKGQRNLTDLYISSYTPTLTALIRSRRPSSSRSAIKEKRFVAIGQAKATGEIELLSVGTELSDISQCVDGLATFTRIEGLESCISRVTEELGKNEWVHLACHGLPNQKHPFESAFALRDGHFTIECIIRCDLEDPEFTYLSACHTTVGDEESPDEVIHLASAMQFAGFRSVIGTMWAVDDGETNKITSTFYTYMVDESGRLDHTLAAYALNKTMKSVNVPLDQRILYVHIGA